MYISRRKSLFQMVLIPGRCVTVIGGRSNLTRHVLKCWNTTLAVLTDETTTRLHDALLVRLKVGSGERSRSRPQLTNRCLTGRGWCDADEIMRWWRRGGGCRGREHGEVRRLLLNRATILAYRSLIERECYTGSSNIWPLSTLSAGVVYAEQKAGALRLDSQAFRGYLLPQWDPGMFYLSRLPRLRPIIQGTENFILT